jgi:hypothetical protein
MILELRQKIKITSKYKAKTKFDFWNEIEIGDIIELRLPVNNITSSGYAPRLKIKNITQNKFYSKFSLTEVSKYLKNIEYIIYEENSYSIY